MVKVFSKHSLKAELAALVAAAVVKKENCEKGEEEEESEDEEKIGEEMVRVGNLDLQAAKYIMKEAPEVIKSLEAKGGTSITQFFPLLDRMSRSRCAPSWRRRG